MKKILLLLLTLSLLFLTFELIELILRTGVYSINSLSDKTVKNSKFASSNIYRILIVGDSCMIAGRKNLGQLLYEDLNKDKKDVYFDVINISSAGVGADHYYQSYKLKGRKYKPDMIFVNLYLGNDLYDTFNNDKTLFDKIKNFFASKFYFYWLIQDTYIKVKYSEKAINKITRKYEKYVPEKYEKNEINPFLIRLARDYPDYFIHNLYIEDKKIKKGLLLVEKYLLKIKSIAQEDRSRLILVLIPDALQVAEKYRNFYKDIGFFTNRSFHKNRILQDRLIEFCRNNDIEFIDLLPEYKKLKKDVYLEDDIHWNDYGISITEKILYNAIKQ